MSTAVPVQQAKTDSPQRNTQLAKQNSNKLAEGMQSKFADNRPQATAQRNLQNVANNSHQSRQLQAVSRMAQSSAQAIQLKATNTLTNASALQRVEEEEPLQAKSVESGTAQRAEQAAQKLNNTGLPDNLKSGIEALSGMSMDHVKVHYNSPQPAQLNAHAYAQGSEIHVAPQQEKHLPHEAWHVVQQAQGRVKPTMQMKLDVAVNDDVGLEAEADVMGAKALASAQLVQKNETRMFASAQVSAQAKTSTAPQQKANNSAFTPQIKSGMPFQLKWLEYGGKHYAWDQLINETQWFYNKETGQMFYERGGVRSEKKNRTAWLDDNDGNDLLKDEDASIELDVEKRKSIEVIEVAGWDDSLVSEVLEIQREWEVKKKEDGEREKSELGDDRCSMDDWTQTDEGIDVAGDLADEENRKVAGTSDGYLRTFIAHYKKEAEPIAVMMIEMRSSSEMFDTKEHLYLRWLVGSPRRKGGGKQLSDQAKIMAREARRLLVVESAKSATGWYGTQGFVARGDAKHNDEFNDCGCLFMDWQPGD
ncbi:DUF4157 domain-containing protein [Solimicrobium silvestre]|uniref:eCIS core domain-containing protein n=1 Tax=Solimicrobium silvestre TaxID=2099400 RepID=A0A2S9GVT6_9BURK|nr:DUF4157 domain-containing protein [Solimicrobium silvestre]PRC91835.1 hypothetical protein S2091_3391 [Solimicrobium silvestre]